MRYVLLAVIFVTGTVRSQTLIQGNEVSLENGKIQRFIGMIDSTFCFTVANDLGDISGLGTINQSGADLKTIYFDPVKSADAAFYVIDNRIITLKTVLDDQHLLLYFDSYTSDLELMDHKVVADHLTNSKRNTGHFKMSVSPAGNYISVLQEAPKPREYPEILKVILLSPEGGIIWQKEHETSYPQSTRPINQIVVSNTGQTHIVKRVRKGASYEFSLYNFRKDETVGARLLDLDGPVIADLSFTIDTSDHLIVTGFFTNSTYDRHEGYFFKRYTADGTLLNSVLRNLPEDLKSIYLGKKASKPDAALINVYIQEVLVKNGYIHIFMEQMNSFSQRDKNGNYDYYYENGPLSLLILDTLGEYVRSKGFELRQQAWNDQSYFSAFRVVRSDVPVLFYNSFESDQKTKTIKGPVQPYFKELDHTGYYNDYLENALSEWVAPSLVYGDSLGNLYLIGTDPERKKIKPLRYLVTEK